MLSSEVVARIRNDVKDVARRRRVCPPDIRRVRKGNFGGLGQEVSRGVSAWACYIAVLLDLSCEHKWGEVTM